MPDWLDWPTWLGSINLFHVAIVLTACWVLFRLLVRFWPWLKKVIALTEALGALPSFIERTDASIHSLRRQIENDHDTNLRDELTEALDTTKRLERGVAGLYTKVDELTASDEELRASDEALRQADERLREDLENTQPSRWKEP